MNDTLHEIALTPAQNELPTGEPAIAGSKQPRLPQRKRRDERDPRLPIADLFKEERARQLWDSLPRDHRRDRFDSKNIPADYRRVFVERKVGEGGQWTSQALNLQGMPEPMTWELAWFIDREVADGRMIDTARLNTVRIGLTLATQHGSAAARAARSITAFSKDEWAREIRLAQLKLGQDTGAHIPVHTEQSIKRIHDRLVYAYHDGEWWQLNVWNPVLDDRIPRREHEPSGRARLNFSHLTTEWLREAAKWWLSTQLATGHYVWSSLKSRLDHLKWFQWYLDEADAVGPCLVRDPHDLRPFIRGFVEALRQHRAMTGPNKGKQLSKNGLRQPVITVETFYRWMCDNAAEAAQVLSEPRWRQLTPQHTALFRPEDKPRQVNKAPDDMVLEDEVISQIATGSGLLAAPKDEGGLDDIQAFHALMLQLRTGRRVSEVLLMDFDPLSPLLPANEEAKQVVDDGQGFVARMAYQQTKIESSQPASIPVDAEIVGIIRAQQEWARQFIASQGAPDETTPRYLFLQSRGNRLGKHPYPSPTYHHRLGALTKLLGLTDSMGRPVQISKTHQFRHTRATNLINAGVPIHVVMRYLGHLTPSMTMHYAKTRAQVAEQEFLRYKKVTADGRAVPIDPSDLFDLLHLDQRADRVLPNGWCLLPPRQLCTKGNACLTCDKFVTDESHRPELERQLTETDALVGRRQAQFTARFGEPMGEDNVWLAGRTAETTALRKVLVSLDQVTVQEDGKRRVVRGAGAVDRPDPPPAGEVPGAGAAEGQAV